MRKFTKAEKAEVLSPEAHKAAQEALRKLGKTSARDLTDDEREFVTNCFDVDVTKP